MARAGGTKGLKIAKELHHRYTFLKVCRFEKPGELCNAFVASFCLATPIL
jgi:hypothetical protein